MKTYVSGNIFTRLHRLEETFMKTDTDFQIDFVLQDEAETKWEGDVFRLNINETKLERDIYTLLMQTDTFAQ